MATQDHIYLRRLMAEEREAKSKAEEIMDAAALAGRDMNDEEKGQIETLNGEWKKAKEALSRAQDDLKLRKMFEDPGAGQDELGSWAGTRQADSGPAAGKTLGEMFVSSGVWKAMKSAKEGDRLPPAFQSESISFKTTALDITRRGTKAAASPLLESNATGLFDAITTVLPGVETPGLTQMAPVIADLLRVVNITVGNQATYRILKARTFPQYPGDLPIDEGDHKPTAAYEFDIVQVPLRKLAAISKISDEWLEDDQATVDFLNMDIPQQLRIEEEAYLAAELYKGVADASNLSNATTVFDKIGSAASVIADLGFNPNAFLITPADWWNALMAKYGTGAGDKVYVGGGPFGSTGSPWNLRPIVTAEATTGHPLVGDFTRGAYIQRKGGLRMDSTNSNDDDFEYNLVTIRAEMREAVKKVYPEAFKTAAI